MQKGRNTHLAPSHPRLCSTTPKQFIPHYKSRGFCLHSSIYTRGFKHTFSRKAPTNYLPYKQGYCASSMYASVVLHLRQVMEGPPDQWGVGSFKHLKKSKSSSSLAPYPQFCFPHEQSRQLTNKWVKPPYKLKSQTAQHFQILVPRVTRKL